MGATGWGLVELVARLLSPNEREAVLGDLAEANQNVLRSLFDVLGLFFRRQGVLWCDWRRCLVGVGVALPSSYLLIGVSASVTSTYVRLFERKVVFLRGWPTGHEGFSLLMCHILLLIAQSWTAGFVVGLSRLRAKRVERTFALALAATVTVLMLVAWKCDALWVLNWGLILPVWYVDAAAWRYVPVSARTA